MEKLLTIAIPTYNRSTQLDQQLAWVSQAIKGNEANCEIFVSDNCSTDTTQLVIQKWQTALPNVSIRANKNSENVGLIGNIVRCLELAKGKYVWTVGDDDPIQERALDFVLNTIRKHSDLALLFLNYSGRHQETGEPVSPPTIFGNRWFDADCDEGEPDGRAVFEHCLYRSIGSVMFITATVYRTELVQQALQKWPESRTNWIAQVYWTGYCAAKGRAIVTQDIFLECIVGASYWQKDPQHAIMMQFKHTPEVYVRLRESGYSNQFYQRMILHSFINSNLRVFLGALRRWPVLSLQIVFPFMVKVGASALNLQTKKVARPVLNSEKAV